MHDMVLKDWRIEIRDIAKDVGISKERVYHILHEELDVRKLTARLDQELVRENICKGRFKRKGDFYVDL